MQTLLTILFIFSAKIQKVNEYTLVFLAKFLFFAYFKVADMIFYIISHSITHVASFSLKKLIDLISTIFLTCKLV